MPKLITHDRYEGLDPQVTEALKNGKTVKGIGWDGGNIYEVELVDYVSGRNYPFTCKTKTGDTFVFIKFTPDYEEEETDWSKVERDAKIIVTDDNGEQYHVHFAKADHGWVYFYKQGQTSWTGKSTITAYKHQCRLAKEGE